MLILLDLRKALDSVDHYLLLGELNRLGFGDRELRWAQSCLDDEPQKAEWQTITCKTVISPVAYRKEASWAVIFIIFINELIELELASEIRCYADDTSAYLVGKDLPNLI